MLKCGENITCEKEKNNLQFLKNRKTILETRMKKDEVKNMNFLLTSKRRLRTLHIDLLVSVRSENSSIAKQ